MNWFTKTIIAASSEERKQKLANDDGACEHVEAEVSLAYSLHCEKDSFGTVGSVVMCQACDVAEKEREGNETEVCRDCKLPVLKKDGFFWRWYDFYAAQGDEPVFICNECRTKPAHVARVRRDDADREAEFGD